MIAPTGAPIAAPTAAVAATVPTAAALAPLEIRDRTCQNVLNRLFKEINLPIAIGMAIGARRRPALILRRGRAKPSLKDFPMFLPNLVACHLTPVAFDVLGRAIPMARAMMSA
jgi:hypothetical protein